MSQKANFEAFYRKQQVVPSNEWDAFLGALHEPLPIVFRIVGGTVHTSWVRNFVESRLKELSNTTDVRFGRLDWYIHGEAFELKASRAILRSHPALRELSQFLINQSENGTIMRQEAVSMIPASFLMDEILVCRAALALIISAQHDDVALLDLCAAPGSKSSQLLEALHNAREPARKALGLGPRGVVVANDINSTRAHMLVHRMKYHCSPSLMVTLHNAALFPRLWDSNASCKFFDGVLCDVPCSGDGTIRKAQSAWKTWSSQAALGLHKLQMKILKKGAALCKIGGRIVYSTCSLNPIENEAVVAGVLRYAEGCLQVEGSTTEGLKSRPGLATWSVQYKRDAWYSEYQDAQKASVPINKLCPSMFAPASDESYILEQLGKCSRYLPHDNDTGGFFVCVFRKVAPCPWDHRKELDSANVDDADVDDAKFGHAKVDNAKVDNAKVNDAKLDDAFRPCVSQKDMFCLASNNSVAEACSRECFDRFGLPAMEGLFSRIWARRPEETESSPASAVPRKLWIVSERTKELLEAFTFKATMRVLYAGTILAENRPQSSCRLSSAGYALLVRYALGSSSSFEVENCGFTRLMPRDLMARALGETDGATRIGFMCLEPEDPLRIFFEDMRGSDSHFMLVAENPKADLLCLLWANRMQKFWLPSQSGEACAPFFVRIDFVQKKARLRFLSMEVRRAFEGTAPALTPGIKVGQKFTLCPNGTAPFIGARSALFDQLYSDQQERIARLPHDPITIQLLDGAKKTNFVANGSTPYDVAKSISEGLAKSALVARVVYETGVMPEIANPEDVDPDEVEPIQETDDDRRVLWDMHRPLLGNCSIEFLKFGDCKEVCAAFWHSSSHLLGLACEQVFGAQLTIGPALQKGFYYDFYGGDVVAVSQDDYRALEETALKHCVGDTPFKRLEVSKEEALELFKDNPFKCSLISAKVPEGGRTSCYRCGPFVDLCMGPHIPNLNKIKAFQVEKHSSAYWLGNRDGDSLQRVYGISFPDSKMLKEHQRIVEEAKKRDHRLLGQQLDLFFFEPSFAAGSAFWLPKGAKVYNKLVDLMRREYLERGFSEVHSPNLYSCDIFRVSGHYQNYKDSMFMLDVEDKDWALKPMNCPGHCCIFKHMSPSYRSLPIRLADFGVLHRNEFSGSLAGLTRVRRFQQDDAHIFCRMDQVKAEVRDALDFLFFIYGIFGFKYELYLSTRPKKALGTVELWDMAESQLKEALDESKVPWKLNKGDGAFYGPKIDIKLFDALDRGHQCGTIQLDFQLPLRFDLQYKTGEDQSELPRGELGGSAPRAEDGSLETELKAGYARPVMIHRAILGSIERMTAVIVEHTGGRFPFWLSPRQAIVCPISEKNLAYADYIREILHRRGFDVEVDSSNNTINKKIREAQVHQWNYILVVGAAEQDERCVMVRRREDPKNQEKMNVPDLLSMFESMRDVAKRASPNDIPDFVESTTSAD